MATDAGEVAFVESEVEAVRGDGAVFGGEATAVGAGGVGGAVGPDPGGLEEEAAGIAAIHFKRSGVVEALGVGVAGVDDLPVGVGA